MKRQRALWIAGLAAIWVLTDAPPGLGLFAIAALMHHQQQRQLSGLV